jgi:hypothetical protein
MVILSGAAPLAQDIANPYGPAPQRWWRGQLHVHTTNSDGADSPAATIAFYERLGYDFIALTDHNAVPSAADMARGEAGAAGERAAAPGRALLVIPGTEYRGAKNGPELGVVGVREVLPQGLSVRAYQQAAVASGGFVAFNHPLWDFHHWPIYWMLGLEGCHALEIYNGVIEWLAGTAECPIVWDTMLTCGHRIFGTATDDAHEARHRGWASVMVNAPALEEKAIVAALKRGDFYATTGVTIREIRVEGAELVVESDNAQEIRFFCERGRLRLREAGPVARCPIGEGDVYLRAELWGAGTAKAWTNPVFVEDAPSIERIASHRAWYLSQPEATARPLT